MKEMQTAIEIGSHNLVNTILETNVWDKDKLKTVIETHITICIRDCYKAKILPAEEELAKLKVSYANATTHKDRTKLRSKISATKEVKTQFNRISFAAENLNLYRLLRTWIKMNFTKNPLKHFDEWAKTQTGSRSQFH